MAAIGNGGARRPSLANGRPMTAAEYAEYEQKARKEALVDRTRDFLKPRVENLRRTDAIYEELLRYADEKKLDLFGIKANPQEGKKKRRRLEDLLAELHGRSEGDYRTYRQLTQSQCKALRQLSESPKIKGNFAFGITGGLGETPVGIVNRLCFQEILPAWRSAAKAPNGDEALGHPWMKKEKDLLSALGVPGFTDYDLYIAKKHTEPVPRAFHRIASEVSQILGANVHECFREEFGLPSNTGGDNEAPSDIDMFEYGWRHDSMDTCGGVLFDGGTSKPCYAPWQREVGRLVGVDNRVEKPRALPFGVWNDIY